MKAKRHERAGDVSELNERLNRRSARLNDAEAAKLEEAIVISSLTGVARAVGISPPALEGVRHSGASTPATIAAVRGWLGGGR